jgi:hypothetical protein
METKQKAFIKKTVTFYIETTLGDKFLAKDICDFKELKDEEGYVVEEKVEVK